MQGIERIKLFSKTAPLCPGVYRMLDQNNKVLYVGKARNIKIRIQDYLRSNYLSDRIMKMVEQTYNVECIITDSEKEALILEASLIRSLKPRYNILLKNDKTFLFLEIKTNQDYPQILSTRGDQKCESKVFGPFATQYNVDKIIAIIQKLFLLRTCNDSFFKTRKQPCLQYQIKRCSAPCVNKISKSDYKLSVKYAQEFLSGRSDQIHNFLRNAMLLYSKNLNYEKAAKIRDQIIQLNKIKSRFSNVYKINNSDFISIVKIGTKVCIQIFFFRNKQCYGKKSYYPENVEDKLEKNILTDFISQIYTILKAPKVIYINREIQDLAILSSAFHTKFIIPKYGYKKEMMDFVNTNCVNTLNRKLFVQNSHVECLEAVGKLLKLDTTIKRIDVFDNSHLFGANAVGAMVVATDKGFDKRKYRLYNMSSSMKGNDYQMMSDIIRRRYIRLLKEYPQYTDYQWPNLIIIDGGPGHYSVIKNTFKELNLQIPFLCIAKGEKRNQGNETLYYYENIFTISNSNIVMQFFQRLRDEAHRFAIKAHRCKRKAKDISSELDNIPNIGYARKKSLLMHFGSLRLIKQASVKDLSQVKNISTSLAKRIFDYLNIRY